jgi:hypothetical protein
LRVMGPPWTKRAQMMTPLAARVNIR